MAMPIFHHAHPKIIEIALVFLNEHQHAKNEKKTSNLFILEIQLILNFLNNF